MKDKAEAAIEKYKMLAYGGQVLVCVSGGADSMALLHFLYSVRQQYGVSLSVCHVNHGIRGEEALRDQRFVEEACSRMGVPCEVVSVHVPSLAKERGLSLEACGREVRYEAFERIAHEKNAKIATAHTLSDSIETMLFNLARGTGLKGLCGIPPVRGDIIRPLIEVTREEVEQYCRENDIRFITDSSNLTREYTRNRIRMDVIPALKQANPAFEQAVSRAMHSLRGDEEYLAAQVQKSLDESEENGSFRIAVLRALPAAILNRAVLTILKRHHIEPQSERVEALTRMLLQGSGCITLTTHTYARVQDGLLSVFTVETISSPDYSVPFQLGELPLYEGVKALVTVLPINEYSEMICSKKIHPKLLKKCLDYDNIIGTAIFRPKNEGDRITFSARGCTKTLKKLFNEAKIPPPERALVPVLADEAGVVWAEGFGCDRRCEVTHNTKNVAVIDIIRVPIDKTV